MHAVLCHAMCKDNFRIESTSRWLWYLVWLWWWWWHCWRHSKRPVRVTHSVECAMQLQLLLIALHFHISSGERTSSTMAIDHQSRQWQCVTVVAGVVVFKLRTKSEFMVIINQYAIDLMSWIDRVHRKTKFRFLYTLHVRNIDGNQPL